MQSNSKELQKTNSALFMMLFAANFDTSRIVIAEHELSENFLTLFLEDVRDAKPTIDETLMYKLPIAEFASVISTNGLNSYDGIKFSEGGRPYEARVDINNPIDWFNEDSSIYQQKEALAAALNHVIKSTLSFSKGVQNVAA